MAERQAAEFGEAVDLARGFIACWTYEGPLDAIEEWARQLRDELGRALGPDPETPCSVCGCYGHFTHNHTTEAPEGERE